MKHADDATRTERHTGRQGNTLNLQTHNINQDDSVSYLSSLWGPAGLFDFPNHSGNQQQRQETAGEREEGDTISQPIKNKWFL